MDDRPIGALRTHALVPCALIRHGKDVHATKLTCHALCTGHSLDSHRDNRRGTLRGRVHGCSQGRLFVLASPRAEAETMTKIELGGPHLDEAATEERIIHGQRCLHMAIFGELNISVAGQRRKTCVSTFCGRQRCGLA